MVPRENVERWGDGAWQDAVLAGWFRTGPDKPVNAAMVLATAGEIASGMAFLHSRGIVHGDLSSGVFCFGLLQHTVSASCLVLPGLPTCLAFSRPCQLSWASC